ncbi:lytic polysaccharide monooxygenase [Streptomyces massasporeus]
MTSGHGTAATGTTGSGSGTRAGPATGGRAADRGAAGSGTTGRTAVAGTPAAGTRTRTATDGYYNFTGDLPARTGRHIVYKVWQRNDSPEAFYSCSDVTFGGAAAQPAAAKAQAPSEAKIAAGASLSTVSHAGHGGDEQAPALSAETAETPTSPLPMALAGAGALAAFGAGSLLLGRRRNSSAS